MKILAPSLTIACLAAFGAAPAGAQNVDEMLKKYACLSCHQVDKKLVGPAYQEVAAKAWAHLEGLADRYATPAREAELIVIFKEATRLEADFWEMGWRLNEKPTIR